MLCCAFRLSLSGCSALLQAPMSDYLCCPSSASRIDTVRVTFDIKRTELSVSASHLPAHMRRSGHAWTNCPIRLHCTHNCHPGTNCDVGVVVEQMASGCHSWWQHCNNIYGCSEAVHRLNMWAMHCQCYCMHAMSKCLEDSPAGYSKSPGQITTASPSMPQIRIVVQSATFMPLHSSC